MIRFQNFSSGVRNSSKTSKRNWAIIFNFNQNLKPNGIQGISTYSLIIKWTADYVGIVFERIKKMDIGG